MDWIVKYIFGTIIAYIYTNPDLLIGQFNSVLNNRILIVINEMNLKKRSDSEALKSLITDVFQNIEKKGIDAKDVDLYCNFIAFSNDFYPIYLQSGDRRICAFDLNNKYSQNAEGQQTVESKLYFDNLTKSLNTESASIFTRYLLNYNISEFNSLKIPHTEARKRLMQGSSNGVETWLKEVFDWKYCGDDYSVKGLNLEILRNLYCQWSKEEYKVPKFREILQKLVKQDTFLQVKLIDGYNKYYLTNPKPQVEDVLLIERKIIQMEEKLEELKKKYKLLTKDTSTK
jgi:hypothetical protein